MTSVARGAADTRWLLGMRSLKHTLRESPRAADGASSVPWGQDEEIHRRLYEALNEQQHQVRRSPRRGAVAEQRHPLGKGGAHDWKCRRARLSTDVFLTAPRVLSPGHSGENGSGRGRGAAETTCSEGGRRRRELMRRSCACRGPHDRKPCAWRGQSLCRSRGARARHVPSARGAHLPMRGASRAVSQSRGDGQLSRGSGASSRRAGIVQRSPLTCVHGIRVRLWVTPRTQPGERTRRATAERGEPARRTPPTSGSKAQTSVGLAPSPSAATLLGRARRRLVGPAAAGGQLTGAC